MLTADQSEETIKRLIAVPVSGPAPPPTLADTGVFTNLVALTSQAGFVPYDLNVPFWSDHTHMMRWFQIPPSQRIVFNPTNNWLFPPAACG